MAHEIYPWLPGRLFVRTQFNNLAKIGSCRQPVFVTHGTADGLIPFAHGKRLFEAANEPKAFLPLTGQGHMLDLDGDSFAELRRFLAKSHDVMSTSSK